MEQLPEPTKPGELRASNDDRERVAAVLRQAAAEGRLELSELDDRLALVYAARTYSDFEPLVRDLPTAASVPLPVATSPGHDVAAPRSAGAVAIMSGFVRKGPWGVPRRFRCFAFWGGGKVDLREAYFLDGAAEIQAVAIMGGVEIVVPDDAQVHVTGLGIMGGFDHTASGAGAPGGPTIVISGFAFWGGVTVRRKRRKKAAALRDGS